MIDTLTVLKVRLPLYFKNKEIYHNKKIIAMSLFFLGLVGGGSFYHFSNLGKVDSEKSYIRPFMNNDQLKKLYGDNHDLLLQDNQFPLTVQITSFNKCK